MSDFYFIDFDPESVYTEALAEFETALGEKLGDADPRRILLDFFVDKYTQAAAAFEVRARQIFARFAEGQYLDWIAEVPGVTRIPAAKAEATIQFTLSAAQSANTVIPQGTRVTPNGSLFFETVSSLVISAGSLTGTVTARCMTAGTVGNGFAVGSLTTLVDPVPFVVSVTNTTASAGGTETETDSALRERIKNAPSSRSTAGSVASYRYWAMSADAIITDVDVYSPSAGTITLTVLTKTGQPSAAVLASVLAAVSSDERRPLTDTVSAQAPTEVTYNETIKYYAPASEMSAVQEAIEGTGGVLDRYEAWQSESLGRGINPGKLTVMLLSAGATRVEITSPASYVALTGRQVAKRGSRSVTREVEP